MKISDLPKKSEARRRLAILDLPRRRERLRCAQSALDVAMFCWERWPDEPAQWIRAEEILRGILVDYDARIQWFIEKKPRQRTPSGEEAE